MLSEQDLYKIKEIIGNSQEIDAESKNELLDKFNKSNLNGYGLNFVRSTEDVEKETYPYHKNKFIFLNEDTEKEIFKGEDLTNNILFEGDNLESLKVLNSTHKGKVDVIYIDPPYNTGNKDFIYNDSFVSNDDGFKHSKWLSFMEKRLKLAYSLLSKDGVIFISIDDNEQANLKLLCDKIFGEQNFISNIIWLNNKKGRQTSKFIAQQNEYVLCYVKDSGSFNIKDKETFSNDLDIEYNLKDEISRYKKGVELTNTNSKFNITTRKNLVYSIYYHEETGDAIVIDEKINNDTEIGDVDKSLIEKGYIRILPRYRAGKGYGCWRWGMDKFRNEYKHELIFEKSKSGVWNIFSKLRLTESNSKITKNKNIIDINGTGIGNKLKDILNTKSFDFPKPIELIKELISMHPNSNATVLDFFAGSGTTGHAVLELNKEDGGNRQFILCTNNENNICEEVTYQRLYNIINGYTTLKGNFVEGIPTNLNYLKVDYIDTNEVYDFSDVDVIPYIELKEGVRYNFIDNFEYCSSKNKYVFLVGIEDDMLKVQEFLQNNDEKEVVIYCNSQSIKNKYFNTKFYPLFKSIGKDTILNISKDK